MGPIRDLTLGLTLGLILDLTLDLTLDLILDLTLDLILESVVEIILDPEAVMEIVPFFAKSLKAKAEFNREGSVMKSVVLREVGTPSVYRRKRALKESHVLSVF
jgi:hypothetical protein